MAKFVTPGLENGGLLLHGAGQVALRHTNHSNGSGIVLAGITPDCAAIPGYCDPLANRAMSSLLAPVPHGYTSDDIRGLEENPMV